MDQTFDLKDMGFAAMEVTEFFVIDGGTTEQTPPIVIPIGTGPTFPTPPILL